MTDDDGEHDALRDQKLTYEVELLRQQVESQSRLNALAEKKLEQEIEKLRVETAKLGSEKRLYPLVLLTGAIVAGGTILTAIVRALY